MAGFDLPGVLLRTAQGFINNDQSRWDMSETHDASSGDVRQARNEKSAINHTPGPWTVGDLEGDEVPIVGPDGQWVGVVWPQGDPDDDDVPERGPNAHLISASPDFLHAAKAEHASQGGVQLLRDAASDALEAGKVGMSSALYRMSDALEAAIGKATASS